MLAGQSRFISYSIEQHMLDLDLDLEEITQNDQFEVIHLACPHFKRESERGRSFCMREARIPMIF